MKKELSAIEKMMAVKTAMEAFGFDFDQVTVGQAFTMFGSIKQAIEQANAPATKVEFDFMKLPPADQDNLLSLFY